VRDISANNSIQFWLNKRCGSRTSHATYLSKIKGFFQHVGTEPDALIDQWKHKIRYDAALKERFIDEWTERIETYIYSSKFEGYASLTRLQILATIKSFFKSHRMLVNPEIPKHCYVKYHNRSINREEISRILEHANLRETVFFLMMAESGLRPNTLAHLQYKHIKTDFKANKVPMMIELPSELLKDRVEARWTFIGQDAFQKLREYLKPRLPLQNDDPVFKAERKLKHESVSPHTFSNIFSRIALKLGIAEHSEKGKPRKIRLYCLRKFFRNNLRADRDYMEFWMAHKTTQSHYISRDVERHREEYAKAYENLRIYKSEEPQTIRKLKEENEELKEIIRNVADRVGKMDQEFVKMMDILYESFHAEGKADPKMQGLLSRLQNIRKRLSET